jgi:hypothetical protein
MSVNYRSVLGGHRNTINAIAAPNGRSASSGFPARATYAKSKVFNDEVDVTAGVTGKDALPGSPSTMATARTRPISCCRSAAALSRLTRSPSRRGRVPTASAKSGQVRRYRPDENGLLTVLKAGIEKRDLTSSSTFNNSVYTLNGINGQVTRPSQVSLVPRLSARRPRRRSAPRSRRCSRGMPGSLMASSSQPATWASTAAGDG